MLLRSIIYGFAMVFLSSPVHANRYLLQKPDFDSGLISMTAGVDTLVTHGLGGNVDDYVVYLTGTTGAYGEGHFGFGGCDQENNRRGFYWHDLTNLAITLKVRNEEWANSQLRVRIWIDSHPDFDSGWQLISPGDTGPLLHNVGGKAEDYIVDLQFMDISTWRPHQMLYGGVHFGNKTYSGSVDGQEWGAYWHSLTNTSANVVRMPQDQLVWLFRGRIFKRPKPAYDSGWLSPSQATGIFISLPFDTENKVVYYEQKDTANGGLGINHAYYGSFFIGSTGHGSYWDNFYDQHITSYRLAGDEVADQIRIRIYDPGVKSLPGTWMLLFND
jgi:hypothetical protein